MIQNYLNGKVLSDLHPSLNKQSKIDYYIEKSRRAKYPFGQNILGVAPYIRSISKYIVFLLIRYIEPYKTF